MSKAYSFGFSQNIGHLFENLIYLDLRRTRHEIYYYLTEGRHEVDFLAIDPFGKPVLLQVVWDITDTRTLQREERALNAAMKELKIDGKMITPENYITDFWSELS